MLEPHAINQNDELDQRQESKPNGWSSATLGNLCQVNVSACTIHQHVLSIVGLFQQAAELLYYTPFKTCCSSIQHMKAPLPLIFCVLGLRSLDKSIKRERPQ